MEAFLSARLFRIHKADGVNVRVMRCGSVLRRTVGTAAAEALLTQFNTP